MKFIILGCGSSMGVPRPDGFFGNCDPDNKKNYILKQKLKITRKYRLVTLYKLKISYY